MYSLQQIYLLLSHLVFRSISAICVTGSVVHIVGSVASRSLDNGEERCDTPPPRELPPIACTLDCLRDCGRDASIWWWRVAAIFLQRVASDCRLYSAYCFGIILSGDDAACSSQSAAAVAPPPPPQVHTAPGGEPPLAELSIRVTTRRCTHSNRHEQRGPREKGRRRARSSATRVCQSRCHHGIASHSRFCAVQARESLPLSQTLRELQDQGRKIQRKSSPEDVSSRGCSVSAVE